MGDDCGPARGFRENISVAIQELSNILYLPGGQLFAQFYRGSVLGRQLGSQGGEMVRATALAD